MVTSEEEDGWGQHRFAESTWYCCSVCLCVNWLNIFPEGVLLLMVDLSMFLWYFSYSSKGLFNIEFKHVISIYQ